MTKQEFIKESVTNWNVGFITYYELVKQLADLKRISDDDDIAMLASAVDELECSEEYYDLLNQFHNKVQTLMKNNKKISTIVDYYCLIANKK